MVKLISFEGGIGSGKSSLTNYFSHKLKIGKILEQFNLNPFLKEFYKGNTNVNFETEITFLLIHYSQLKEKFKQYKDTFLISDFSIEKDLVFAKLNLENKELKIFQKLYNYVIKKVGVPYLVIYLDLSNNLIINRITQRKREYEVNANLEYFKEFNKKIKKFFETESKSKTWFINVDNLEFDPDNKILQQIQNKILEVFQ